MINWAKPVLIDGVRETFTLAGTLNGCQVVITTDENGAQTLFTVNDHGDSSRFSCNGPGPKFENESEIIERVQFRNVYADGKLGNLWDSRSQADRAKNHRRGMSSERKRVAVQKIITRIHADGEVSTNSETVPTYGQD